MEYNSRLLYVGQRITVPKGGADQVNNRNQVLLESIFDGRVDYISTSSNGIFDNIFFGVSSEVLKQIDTCISSGQYDYVFLSHSLLGKAARYIKKTHPRIKIITFFHNIEVQYANEYRKTNGIKAIPFYLAVKYWERVCCENVDCYITLNKRDSKILAEVYGKTSTIELPTSFDDKYDYSKACECASEYTPSIDYLFVGVSFFANVQGVQWFIDNVMPNVKGHFYVIGKGMDSVEFRNMTPNIHIHGFVDDLSEYYYRAHVVVSPIFVGGGMKTKTAEALMYGKTIIGTTEAFEGYQIDSNCMKLCNTKEEFLNALNSEISNTTNKFARDLFESCHSNRMALLKLQTVFHK